MHKRNKGQGSPRIFSKRNRCFEKWAWLTKRTLRAYISCFLNFAAHVIQSDPNRVWPVTRLTRPGFNAAMYYDQNVLVINFTSPLWWLSSIFFQFGWSDMTQYMEWLPLSIDWLDLSTMQSAYLLLSSWANKSKCFTIWANSPTPTHREILASCKHNSCTVSVYQMQHHDHPLVHLIRNTH